MIDMTMMAIIKSTQINNLKTQPTFVHLTMARKIFKKNDVSI